MVVLSLRLLMVGVVVSLTSAVLVSVNGLLFMYLKLYVKKSVSESSREMFEAGQSPSRFKNDSNSNKFDLNLSRF